MEGRTLGELGLDDTPVRQAFTLVAPVTEETEKRDIIVSLGVVPLVEDRIPVGALVLIRDITELRRKERLLLSKDATIREIHHRVKNNLQTIASLLRLQGRRLYSPEAKAAIEESVRRIRSIALVHETLSRDIGEVVPFRTIVKPLVSMVKEGLTAPETSITFSVDGDPGDLPAEVATPLAVVLTELLQNAVEHGFGIGPDGTARPTGEISVVMRRDDHSLRIEVRDSGAGLPEGFDPECDAGLGLQIVRALVRSELSGFMTLESDGGTVARVEIPIPDVIG
jgi:two-component sensor histidine kinase